MQERRIRHIPVILGMPAKTQPDSHWTGGDGPAVILDRAADQRGNILRFGGFKRKRATWPDRPTQCVNSHNTDLGTVDVDAEEGALACPQAQIGLGAPSFFARFFRGEALWKFALFRRIVGEFLNDAFIYQIAGDAR